MNNKYKPEIKICGITNLDDARAAVDAGADYLGFVLYEKSPRAISPSNLGRLLEKLGRKIKTVGVFVNKSMLAVSKIAGDCGLDIIQLCGEEQPDAIRLLARPVWRVIRMENNIVVPALEKWPACNAGRLAAPRESGTAGGPVERYVLDSSQTGLYGGTGVAMDWTMAAGIAAKHKIMLAGGLTPKNVATAIRLVRPFGVDVSSGIELKHGIKDHEKMRFFIEVVKCACHDNSI